MSVETDRDAPASALAHFSDNAAAIMELQIELCEIPAPSGEEERRGEVVARWLRTSGCDVRRDDVGNVIGLRKGTGGAGAVALSAHLDSVFPPGQEVTVIRAGEASPYREGARVPAGELQGPGISDDAAGLAALIAVAQVLAVADAETERDILFVATVGEEGRGNLRGARHFFSQPAGAELTAFVTIDHPDPEVIAHRGVGSRRYSIEFRGPGGHAWGHFGRYNPALAMASAAQRIGAITPPAEARCTFNVGVMEAGRSVNAIPETARMEVDLRSDENRALDVLEAAMREAVAEGQAEELSRRASETARVVIEPIGDRPAGETPAESALVAAAQRALAAEGFSPRLTASSTDANAAMAAGVAAICVSWGGRSGNQHSLREFFVPAGRERTLAAILRLLVEVASAPQGRRRIG